jgi:ribosomal protein S18 acetylase RimI-like enzyme
MSIDHNDRVSFNRLQKSKNTIISYLNENAENFTPPLQERIDILSFSEKLFKNAIQFWAEHDDRLVSFAGCYFNCPNKEFGFISTISVIKSYQNLGIGTLLLDKIIEFAKENQFREVRLEVYCYNKQAIQFYLAYGFKKIEIRKNKFFLSFNIL